MKKFDMHCHTREGSMDAHVSIFDYANTLKCLGYGGMLVTDHNTYDGFHRWEERMGKKPERRAKHPLLIRKQNKIRKQIAKGELKPPARLPRDFVVLKGIEYDTKDAGHILVVMPTGVNLKVLELRGLRLKRLIRLVHHYGGILGPAHPFGERYLSYFATMKRKKLLHTINEFDFIEVFNACEDRETNLKALYVSRKYGLPGFGGSDSHKQECIGTACTYLPDFIKNEDDLISYIKERPRVKAAGRRYYGTTKDRLGRLNIILVQGFFFYNLVAGKFRAFDREKEHFRLVVQNRIRIMEQRNKRARRRAAKRAFILRKRFKRTSGI